MLVDYNRELCSPVCPAVWRKLQLLWARQFSLLLDSDTPSAVCCNLSWELHTSHGSSLSMHSKLPRVCHPYVVRRISRLEQATVASSSTDSFSTVKTPLDSDTSLTEDLNDAVGCCINHTLASPMLGIELILVYSSFETVNH